MSDLIETNLQALDRFVQENGWSIHGQKEIDYGQQVIVTDGTTRLPVNLFRTGKIVVQGKSSDMKTQLTQWADLLQSGLTHDSGRTPSQTRQNRVAKYLVLPDNIEHLRSIVMNFPGEATDKETGGPAEVYRVEALQDGSKLTITQYNSGTLLVQGLSSSYFDLVCDVLDEHLTQSFSERATRLVIGDAQRVTAAGYLEAPNAENEATIWLLEQIEHDVLGYLYENDRRTLLAAAGVRNAFCRASDTLPDYSVVVMPFAKPFEGFLMKLAVHLGLTTEDALKTKATEIEVGNWLNIIAERLPDVKRYGEIHAALYAAWQCRNKTLHSDFAHPLSTLKTFAEAEHEVATILRAMARSHRVFVKEDVKLTTESVSPKKASSPSKSEAGRRYELVNASRFREQLEADGYSVLMQPEGRRNLWEVSNKPDLIVLAPRAQEGTVIIKGSKATEFCVKYRELLEAGAVVNQQVTSRSRIGVDESGKGDLFGPLVVAGVVVTPDLEVRLAQRGVRDSKTLSDVQIRELAQFIRSNCFVEILLLLPQDYNKVYEQQGRNLNRLLAWGHAQVITKLSRRASVERAISDQFGNESLLVEALKTEGCEVNLEQRPRAEDDLAVAAASIVARAEFVASMDDFTRKAGFEIPLGSSANQVKETGKRIYRLWGRKGLERIAKMHFRTIQEIISEVDK